MFLSAKIRQRLAIRPLLSATLEKRLEGIYEGHLNGSSNLLGATLLACTPPIRYWQILGPAGKDKDPAACLVNRRLRRRMGGPCARQMAGHAHSGVIDADLPRHRHFRGPLTNTSTATQPTRTVFPGGTSGPYPHFGVQSGIECFNGTQTAHLRHMCPAVV